MDYRAYDSSRAIIVEYFNREGERKSMIMSNESWIGMTGLHNFGLDSTRPIEIWQDGHFIKAWMLNASGHPISASFKK